MVSSTLSISQYHLYAQKLNNSAAMCIEVGQYDRAIFSLSKALRLSKEQSDESMMSCCMCRDCTLDGCIAYSEVTTPIATCNRIRKSSESSTKCSGSAVYERPIRIPPVSIIENHNMGRTLFLIITFNLALAHHLGAIVSSPSTTGCERVRSSISNDDPRATRRNLQTSGNKIKKALQLYEVSQNWYSRISSFSQECESTTSPHVISCIRFRLILSNNLSHIHRLASNYTKHRQCLEHLLSTVMVAVEYKTRNHNSSNDSTISNSNTNNDAVSTESTAVSRNNGVLCTTNLEGFLMNASRLFLDNHCAEAA